MRDPIVDSLRHIATETLRPVVEGVRSCALLSYPNHSNPGDGVIWLGTKRWLAEEGVRVAYQAATKLYSPERLVAKYPEGPIFLHGGGNFGDLWMAEHVARERVLRDFPDRPIVQLPQSVFFLDKERARPIAQLIRNHRNFTCFVRDAGSKKRYEELFDREAILCPDMGMFFDATRRGKSAQSVVELFRGDQEAVAGAGAKDAWIRRWVTPEATLLLGAQEMAVRCAFPLPGLFFDLLSLRYDAVSRQRIAVAERLLSRGRVVVTDRLHAHILCVLLGIPNVILDNSYGKVHSFIKQWTGGSSLVRLATSLDEARSLAAAMA